MKRDRKPVGNSLRVSIFTRDAYTCAYCGRRPPQVVLHVEHMISVHDGGSNHPSNLVTSCSDCNHGKHRRSLLITELVDPCSDLHPLDFVVPSHPLPLPVLEDFKPLPDEYFDLLLDAVREAHKKTWEDEFFCRTEDAALELAQELAYEPWIEDLYG